MNKEYRGRRKLGELAEMAIMPVAKRHGLVMFKILSNWSSIVGELLAKHTSPKSLTFPNNKTANGVLHISVENPGFSLELQASERLIIQKISTFFGYQAVDRIKVEISLIRKMPIKSEPVAVIFKQSLPPEQISEVAVAINDVEDDSLKNLLAEIAKNSFTSN